MSIKEAFFLFFGIKRTLLGKIALSSRKGLGKMKKIVTLILAFLLLFGVLGIAVGAATANFGYGAQVVASDVDMIKTGLSGKKLCFSDADFKAALCLTDFDTITITKIPSSTEGTLLLGGRRVGEGRVIKRKNLGSLVFVPASETVSECRFAFTVDGYAGGAEIECIMKFIGKVNYAPEATENTVSASRIKTQESIAVYGNLTARDPEGDSMKYIIVSYPKHGSVRIADEESGRYCYTPKDGFTGSDKFIYVARDEYGNYSEPITVKVRITERMCDTEYVDMEERAEYNAAVAMTAMGIMNGRMLGDDMYFLPDEEVSRAEFVAMTMKSCGIRPDSTIQETYFDDDRDISASLKPYIATAQRIGLINGDFKDGKLIFAPNESITKYEAAKIMATLIGADAEGEESVFATDDEVPVWARAGVYAMCSLGIFDSEEGANPTGNVTRADVANYLYKMSEIV